MDVTSPVGDFYRLIPQPAFQVAWPRPQVLPHLLQPTPLSPLPTGGQVPSVDGGLALLPLPWRPHEVEAGRPLSLLRLHLFLSPTDNQLTSDLSVWVIGLWPSLTLGPTKLYSTPPFHPLSRSC